MEDFIKDIVEDIFKPTYSIGLETERDGKKIKITDGQFYSNGRVSNFWYWKEIREDGSLSEETFHGYGA